MKRAHKRHARGTHGETRGRQYKFKVEALMPTAAPSSLESYLPGMLSIRTKQEAQGGSRGYAHRSRHLMMMLKSQNEPLAFHAFKDKTWARITRNEIMTWLTWKKG